jgi:hypothetical protein
MTQVAVVRAQYYYYYITTNGTVTITGGTGSGPMVIPRTINGYPVVAVGPHAFANPSITSVIITNGATSIGDWTFHHCAALTNVVLGSSITNIGYYAFGCCSNLIQITVDPANPVFSDVNGVLFDKSQTTLIRYPNGLVGGYSVPGSVSSIGPSAFSRCATLDSITIPNGVTSIGNGAFDFCSGLGSVEIPDSVAAIGSSTFAKCTGLTNVTFGASVTNIGSLAFVFCTNLTSVAIPGNVTVINSDAFDFCSGLTNLTLTPGVENIGSAAFWSCTSLLSISFPNSVTNIGNDSFWSCTSLANVTVGAGVSQIGTNAFYWCPSLIGISVDPDNAAYRSINGVLFDKGLTMVLQCPAGQQGNYAVPNGITTIGAYAFSDSLLSTISLPNTVTYIGPSAFDDCVNLTGLHFDGNAPGADTTAFNDDTNVTIYYLPKTTGWGAKFDGVPAFLWSLQLQTGPDAPVIQAGQFGFNITGTTNMPIVIETCTNLFNPVWQPIQTNVLTGGSSYFNDPQWTNWPERFYRLSAP